MNDGGLLDVVSSETPTVATSFVSAAAHRCKAIGGMSALGQKLTSRRPEAMSAWCHKRISRGDERRARLPVALPLQERKHSVATTMRKVKRNGSPAEERPSIAYAIDGATGWRGQRQSRRCRHAVDGVWRSHERGLHRRIDRYHNCSWWCFVGPRGCPAAGSPLFCHRPKKQSQAFLQRHQC
jgi:hypothetical protein